jgi:hypothetical protein
MTSIIIRTAQNHHRQASSGTLFKAMYIAPDGTVDGHKPLLRKISDLFQGIFDFVALFFNVLTNPPQRIESRATVSSPWHKSIKCFYK